MPRAPKHCGHHGCPVLVVGKPYCPTHTAEQQARANTTQRGYGAHHQHLRAQWAPRVATGTIQCWRCHKPITIGQTWHLGHDDDRSRYRGPEHARCNTVAAAQSKTRQPEQRPPF